MPDRRPYLCLVAILATYVSGYALFPAGAFTSSDESAYVEQAVVFANGSLASVSPYPPGTSLLQSPFVAIAGWRAAPWLSLLALGATVLLMARWLRDAGYHPGFALLFVAYAPTLVMARVGTSEVPSAAMVTLGLWLFWTGQDARWKWGLAGWLAGLSILLRETNILLFLPFLTAATASRRPGWLVLASTAAAGLATAVLGYWLTAATLPGLRVTAGFSMDAVGRNIGIYAICMLVLAPGGLAAIATYKGRERRALTAAVAGYLAVYLFYDYSGQDSAPIARLAAVGRYLIPLIPLVTIAWADWMSRLVVDAPFRRAAVAAFVLTAGAAFSVHPTLRIWTARDADIVTRIAATARTGLVIADDRQRRYVAPMFGQFNRHWIIDTPVGHLPALTSRHAGTYVVNVYRSDTALMQSLSMDARSYVKGASRICVIEPVIDRAYGEARRLQIWRLSLCGQRVAPASFLRAVPATALLFAPAPPDPRDTIDSPEDKTRALLP